MHDLAVRIDNERGTVRYTRRRDQHAVLGGDFSAEITEERVFGLEFARPVIEGWLVISADSKDLRISAVEVLDTSLVSGELLCSTTGKGGRKERKNDRLLAAVVRKLDLLIQAAVQFEVGRGIPNLQVRFAGLNRSLRKQRSRPEQSDKRHSFERHARVSTKVDWCNVAVDRVHPLY